MEEPVLYGKVLTLVGKGVKRKPACVCRFADPHRRLACVNRQTAKFTSSLLVFLVQEGVRDPEPGGDYRPCYLARLECEKQNK